MPDYFKDTEALYRDGALSKVGLPDQNIEECRFALFGLLLNLSDNVTEVVPVGSSYKVARSTVTICHYVIICKNQK